MSCGINIKLIPVKGTYFFLLAAVGSLLPFLSVYMKELGLSASETSLIYGLMPFLGALFRPVIGLVADKTQSHKVMLIVSLISAGVLHAMLLAVPANHPVEVDINRNARVKIKCNTDISQIEYCTDTRQRLGKTCQIPANQFLNLSASSHGVADPFKNTSDCLLVCDVLLPVDLDPGICFSSDIKNSLDASMLDCADIFANETISSLEFIMEDMNYSASKNLTSEDHFESEICHYYSMSAFHFNGSSYQKLVCQNHTLFDCHIKCEQMKTVQAINCLPDEMDYKAKFSLTFWLFFLIMLGGQVAFSPVFSLVDAILYQHLGDERGKWGKQRLWGTLGFSLAGISSSYAMDYIQFTVSFIAFLVFMCLSALSAYFFKGSQHAKCSSILENLHTIVCKKELIALFFAIFTFGMFTGLVETFLFWHLQSLGASKTLMGLCLVLNCLPEIPVLYLSSKLIKRMGQVNCLYCVFFAYALRFLIYSFLINPWYVLLAEPLHGFTYGLMYAAASSYGSLYTPDGMHGTVQGLIGALHFGFGRGLGSVIWGQVFQQFGAVITFKSASITSIFAFFLYLFSQIYIRRLQSPQKLESGILLDVEGRKITDNSQNLPDLPTQNETDVTVISNNRISESASKTPLMQQKAANDVDL